MVSTSFVGGGVLDTRTGRYRIGPYDRKVNHLQFP